jgi:hypothetical protein
VAILNVGSYDDEGTTLARLHGEYLSGKASCRRGGTTGIYLSGPRRTEPARLRTVLRQPEAPAG